MSNGNNNGHHPNGTGNGLVHVNGHKPDAAIIEGNDLLWDGLPPAVTSGARTAHRPQAGLPAQGPRRSGTFSYIEGHTAITEANRSSASAGGALNWWRTSPCAPSRRSMARPAR